MLIDGVVTQQQVLPGADTAHSTLSITGEDLTVVMKQIDFSGFPFPATPAEGRVGLMLLKYAWLGIVPMVIPSVMIDVPIPTNQIPSQQGTDFDYINELADKVGYVFYLEPQSTPGMSVGYWGPQIKVGVPQPALNINMDAHSNCESLSFTFDNQLREMPTVFVYNELTKVPDSHPDSEHHAAQSAARPGRAAAGEAQADRGRVEVLDPEGGDDRHGQGRAHAPTR